MTDKPTPKEMDDLFVEETGFDPDDFPAAIFCFTRAALTKWGTPATGGEPAGTVGYTVHGTQYVNWRTKPPAHGTPLYTTPQPTQAQAAEPVARTFASHAAGEAGYCLFSRPVPSETPLYAAPQPVAREQLTPERVKEIVRSAGYDQCGIPDTEREAFINGLRHGEHAHGIKDKSCE